MNNKGFAITSLVYSAIILLSVIIFTILAIESSNYSNQKDYVSDIDSSLNNVVTKDIATNTKDNLFCESFVYADYMDSPNDSCKSEFVYFKEHSVMSTDKQVVAVILNPDPSESTVKYIKPNHKYSIKVTLVAGKYQTTDLKKVSFIVDLTKNNNELYSDGDRENLKSYITMSLPNKGVSKVTKGTISTKNFSTVTGLKFWLLLEPDDDHTSGQFDSDDYRIKVEVRDVGEIS